MKNLGNSFSAETVSKIDSSCGICLAVLGNRTVKTTCPNPHFFHVGCLKRWFDTQFQDREVTTCPNCRADLQEITTPLNDIKDDMTDQQIRTACKESLVKGQQDLEEAKSNNLFLGYAIKNLQFAHDNGEAQATPLLCQARLLQGQQDLEEAKSNNLFFGYAINNLQFAHDNGEAQATPLLCQARLLQGQQDLEKAKSNNWLLGYAIKDLQFAHDNGEAQATPLLCQARLLRGQQDLEKAKSNNCLLGYAIKDLQFAHDNGEAGSVSGKSGKYRENSRWHPYSQKVWYRDSSGHLKRRDSTVIASRASETQATPLLCQARLLRGQQDLEKAKSNNWLLGDAIKDLQFANANGDVKIKSQAKTLLTSARELVPVQKL